MPRLGDSDSENKEGCAEIYLAAKTKNLMACPFFGSTHNKDYLILLTDLVSMFFSGMDSTGHIFIRTWLLEPGFFARHVISSHQRFWCWECAWRKDFHTVCRVWERAVHSIADRQNE